MVETWAAAKEALAMLGTHTTVGTAALLLLQHQASLLGLEK